MNILLIGNGFDIAHELPTTYADFLKFVEVIKQIISGTTDSANIEWKDINYRIKDQIMAILRNPPDKSIILLQKNKWIELINDNLWIEYFLQCQSYIGENWIDFESEISKVIQQIDKHIKGTDLNSRATKHDGASMPFLDYFVSDENKLEEEREREFQADLEKRYNTKFSPETESEYRRVYQEEHPLKTKPAITYKEIFKRLESDLNKLILALEIYIAGYVDKLVIDKKSPDIERLLNAEKEDKRLDRFISFNYSHTLENVYGVKAQEVDDGGNLDFIHGEARKNIAFDIIQGKVEANIAGNNMILGIDEYIKGKEKNKNLIFITFKKYYQRIYKKTGNQAKCWADKIKKDLAIYRESVKEAKIKSRYQNIAESPMEMFLGHAKLPKIVIYETHRLYIFGHSLDITDKDILKSLILNDNVQTTIFYHNEEAHAKYIANLVKIIGQDELIKRTGGLYKTITFQQQESFK